MKKFEILLSSQTVGTLVAADEPAIGSIVTVTLQDENGNKINLTGVVEDILDITDLD